MQNIKINLNNTVKFKITKDGEKYLANLNSTHNVYKLCPISFKKDSNGYSEAQLWELFQYFGEAIYMGSQLPIETEILINI